VSVRERQKQRQRQRERERQCVNEKRVFCNLRVVSRLIKLDFTSHQSIQMSKRGSSQSKQKAPTVNRAKIEALFATIVDEEDPDVADFDGIAKLAELINIDPTTDVRILVLLWKMGVSVTKPGQISKSDFVEGMEKNLKLDSVEGLQALLPSLDLGFIERQEFRGISSLHRCFIITC
jgi:hypothetical protein